jgi:hypothetical protein
LGARTPNSRRYPPVDGKNNVKKSGAAADGLMAGAAILIGCTGVPPAPTKQAGAASLDVREEFDLCTPGLFRGRPGAAVAVTWSPDGSALAAASNYGGVLSVWDRAGHPINQIKRAGGGPNLEGSLAFINGSSQLVFSPPETPNNSTAFAVWDVSISLGAVAGSPKGDLIMAGVGGTSVNGGEFYGTPEQRAWAEAIDSNGAVRMVRMFHVRDGAQIAAFPDTSSQLGSERTLCRVRRQ